MNYNQSIMKMAEILAKKFIEHDKSGMSVAKHSQPFSFSEWMVLIELSRNERMTHQALLSNFQIDRGIMATVIKRLVSQQLIQKDRDDEDKRKVYISLTAAGKKIAEGLSLIEDEALQFVMKDLSVNEQKAILKFLSRINQLTVDKYDDFEIE